MCESFGEKDVGNLYETNSVENFEGVKTIDRNENEDYKNLCKATDDQRHFQTRGAPVRTATDTSAGDDASNKILRIPFEENSNNLDRILQVINYQLDVEILHKWREIIVIEEEMERGKDIMELLQKLIVNEYVYGDGTTQHGNQNQLGSYHTNTLTGPHRVQNDHNSLYHYSDSKRRLSRATSCINFRGERSLTAPTYQYEVRPDGQIVKMRCPKCKSDQFRSMLGFLNHCRIHCRLNFSSQDDRLHRCGVLIDPSEVPVDYFTKHPTQVKQEMDLALIRADVIGPLRSETSEAYTGISTKLLDQKTTYSFDTSYLKGRNHNAVSRFYISKLLLVGNCAKRVVSLPNCNKPSKEMYDLPIKVNESNSKPLKVKKDSNIKNISPKMPYMDEEDDTNEFIPTSDTKEATHKWRFYLRSPKGISENLGDIIRLVRLYLHPSYHPNEIVDLHSPPFELSRYGWGDFPLRAQIFFWDSDHNKPLEIIHQLKVCNINSSKFTTAAEFIVSFNIDKRSTLLTENQRMQMPKSSLYFYSPLNTSHKSELNSLEKNSDLLALVAEDFPIIGKKGKRAIASAAFLPRLYRPVASREEFRKLPANIKANLEISRAESIVLHINAAFPTAGFFMDTESVVEWCRKNGFTPGFLPGDIINNIDETLNLSNMDIRSLRYCRFCGIPHSPQEHFEILQKNCSKRPRKIHLSTRTSASMLLAPFEKITQDEIKSDVTYKLSGAMNHGASIFNLGARGTHSYNFGPRFPSFSSNNYIYAHIPLDSLDPWISNINKTIKSFTPCTLEDRVTSLLSVALRLFITTLVKRSLDFVDKDEKNGKMNVSCIFMTPMQVFEALSSRREYDFLCNTNMLFTVKSSGKSPST